MSDEYLALPAVNRRVRSVSATPDLEDTMNAPARPHVTAERPLDGAVLSFDLPLLLKRLKGEATWHSGSRNSVTLVKGQRLRIVLVAMHSRTAIPMHHADSPLSIQLIHGSLLVRTDTQVVRLRKGQLLTLQAQIPHALEALRESAFLLTLSTERLHPAEH
jgi:quercetin dioxygenase-like cupin family protein